MNLSPNIPQYILFSSSNRVEGTWHFSICSPTGVTILEVSDREPEAQGDRLELLPVVLGLEALEQPSKITLSTPSRYVQEGIRFGLPEWQANGWQWEFFGEMVPVKNRDLWQRIERAMRFHQVECRFLRFDPPHRIPPGRNLTPLQRNPIAPSTKNVSGFSGSRPQKCKPPTLNLPLAQTLPYCPWDAEDGERKTGVNSPQGDTAPKKAPVLLPRRPPLQAQHTPSENGTLEKESSQKLPNGLSQQESSTVSVGGTVSLYSLFGSLGGPSPGAFFWLGKRLWGLLQRWMSKLRPMVGNVFLL